MAGSSRRIGSIAITGPHTPVRGCASAGTPFARAGCRGLPSLATAQAWKGCGKGRRVSTRGPYNHPRLTLISMNVEHFHKPSINVPCCAKSWHEGAERRKSIGVKQIPCIEGIAYGEAGWRGIFVEPAGGLEPPTHGLQIHCATRCATPADIAVGFDLRPFDSPRQRKGAESQGSTAMGQYGSTAIGQ
jgi:hypothetical protein